MEHAIEDVTLSLGDANSEIDAYQRAVDGLPLDALKKHYETIQEDWEKLKTDIAIEEAPQSGTPNNFIMQMIQRQRLKLSLMK